LPSVSSFSRGAGLSGIGFWKLARRVFSALVVAVDDFGLLGGGVGLCEEAMLDFNCCRSNNSFGGDKSRIGESVIFWIQVKNFSQLKKFLQIPCHIHVDAAILCHKQNPHVQALWHNRES